MSLMETQTYFLDQSKLSLKNMTPVCMTMTPVCLILTLAFKEDQAGYGLTGSTRTCILIACESTVAYNSVSVFRKELYSKTV